VRGLVGLPERADGRVRSMSMHQPSFTSSLISLSISLFRFSPARKLFRQDGSRLRIGFPIRNEGRRRRHRNDRNRRERQAAAAAATRGRSRPGVVSRSILLPGDVRGAPNLRVQRLLVEGSGPAPAQATSRTAVGLDEPGAVPRRTAPHFLRPESAGTFVICYLVPNVIPITVCNPFLTI